MRDIIQLIEDKTSSPVEQIKLPYARTALAPVMSSATIDLHYGKLYKGYVDRFNNGEGDANFNEAGAFLHEIYFTQFQKPTNNNQPSGSAGELIIKQFKTFEKFKEEFEKTAMKIQGSGWVYLAKEDRKSTRLNSSHSQQSRMPSSA